MFRSVSGFALVLLMGRPSPTEWKSRPHATVTTGFICCWTDDRGRDRPTAPTSSSTAHGLSAGRRHAGAGPRVKRSSCWLGIGTRVATTRCSATSIAAAPARCGAAAAARPTEPVNNAEPHRWPTRGRYAVLLLSTAAFITYLDRVCMSVAAPVSKGTWGCCRSSLHGYLRSSTLHTVSLRCPRHGWATGGGSDGC